MDLLGNDSSLTNLSDKERESLKQALLLEMNRRKVSSEAKLVREIVPIKTWLESEYFMGPDNIRVYDYWKETISSIYDPNRKPENGITELILSGCFTGDTMIPLLDGRVLSMKELTEKYGMDNPFWVYSCDERGNIVPGKAFNVRKTGKDKQIVRVTLDSGDVIECTSSHPFMMRDGSYKPAGELGEGDSLMPLYREYTQKGRFDPSPSEYERVYNPADGIYYLTHSIVSSKINGDEIECLKSIGGGDFITTHHKNFNKRDNRPENLKPMLSKEHFRYHSELIRSLYSDPVKREEMCKIMKMSNQKAWDGDDGSRRGAASSRMRVVANSAEYLEGHWKEVQVARDIFMNSEEGKEMARKNISKWNENIDPIKEKKRIESMVKSLSKYWESDKGEKEKKVRSKRLRDLNNSGHASRISKGYWDSEKGEEFRESKAGICRERNSNPDFIKLASKNRSKAVRDKNRTLYEDIGLTMDELVRAIQLGSGWEEVATNLNITFNLDLNRHSLNKVLKAYNIDNKNEFRDMVKGEYKNHKVMSVEYTDRYEDVYDFEVEGYHNFAIEAGVFVHNSIGVGKSTCANIVILRRLYELSCYQNITSLFNLMSTSNIVFLYFSVNKHQAELTGFGDIKSMIDSIPYFNEEFPRNDRIDSLILFPENIMLTYGSGSQHAIGMNMLGSILDEANFFQGESKDNDIGSGRNSKVSELYSSIVNRSKSRFVNNGIDSSINILVSSSTHETSFTEQRIQASKDDPHTLVRCPTLWEVKPKAYCGKMFYIFKGNNSLDPYIVKSVDDLNQYKVSEGMKKSVIDENVVDEAIINEEIEKLPEAKQTDFLAVPVELRKGFDTNLMQSLQDLGGVSVAPTGRLFTSKPVYNLNVKNYIKHPFVSESIIVSTGDKVTIQDYLRSDFRFKDMYKPRYIHIDQSLVTDHTGISCVYVDEIVEVDGVKVPIIATDFMIEIIPPKPPKRIAIYKIRNFMVFLRDSMGLKIGKLSYDIFNSEESRQILNELNFNVSYQSVDRNDKAYVDFVVLLYEERMRMYNYEPAKRELFHLIHDRVKRKVDHPKTNGDGTPGSKDVMDSLVGAVQNALTSTFFENESRGGISDFRMANPMGMDFYDSAIGLRGTKDRTLTEMIDAEIAKQLDSFDDF